MRLIELSANQPSFHTVRFNRTGLTLIVGSQSAKGSTYNGVGKSLLVELLHFCLGSKKNAELENKIPEWEFSLTFEVGKDGASYTVTRSTSRQNVVLFNNVETKLNKFVDWLESQTFFVPPNIPGLSFRTLIPFFLRRGQRNYNNPREAGTIKSPYDELVRNAFLLGIDTNLVAKKHNLRWQKEEIKRRRLDFKKDPLLKQFYLGSRDAGIHISFLESRLKSLEANRDAFVVAENFYDLQKAADELAIRIEHLKNEAFLARSAIQNIDESMKRQPKVPAKNVDAFYQELRSAFREEALKRLDEVAQFHERLLLNRTARLSGEKGRLLEVLANVEKALREMQPELDRRLGFLGQARALDQYTALVNEIAEVTAQIQKLRDYGAIEVEYSNREAALEVQLSEEVIRSNAYLEETRDQRERSFGTFSKFARTFYPNVPAGISVKTNSGDNQTRFDLEVHIENDSSDGINEVRIFCYDLTLVTLRAGHRIRFLFHDSRLFANMDVRQRATLFRLAKEVSGVRDFQYIASLNPDEMSGMEAEFAPAEFADIVASKVVLELKDDSPAGKLLGIQVDMSYDRK